MDTLRYLDDVATLSLDGEACAGCGDCLKVCPHQVFEMNGKISEIVDLNGCMECGACANNCPSSAIRVNPGVGCAAYIIGSWIKGKDKAPCNPDECC